MKFIDFLKKYSTISNKFIDDFYNIMNEDYIEKMNEFLIDSDLLQKWLNIKSRDNLVNTLKKSYVIKVDYDIEIITKKVHGGHNKKIYIITPTAAKKIAMSSKSNISKQVQNYFIEIEYILHKYKNYIIKNLNKKIKIIEKNQKPKLKTRKGIIYIFKALNTNATLYKLGKTINSGKRFNSHNSPMANDIEIVFMYESNNLDQLESCVKIFMKKAQYRKYKEIYEIDIDILKKTIKKCDNTLNIINNTINQNGSGKIKKNENLFMLIPQIKRKN